MKRRKNTADLGDLERSVMDAVWASPTPMLVRDILDVINEDRDLAYTTVMTVTDRLAKKGLLDRDRDGRAWRYSAAASKEELTADALRTTLDDLGGGQRQTVLMHFLDGASPQEVADLQAALNAVEKRQANP